MIRKFRRFMKGKRGQGMSEYIIMLGLVAIAAIGIYTAFGKQIRSVMGAIAAQMSGNTTAESTLAGNIVTQGSKDVTLSNFGND